MNDDPAKVPQSMHAQQVRTPSGLRVLQVGVMLTGVLLVVLFLFGQNLSAKWWIIDDHEIMWFVGKGDRLPMSEIGPKLMQSEVGPQGGIGRFRPTYYALRLIEASAWGKRPDLWYAFRLFVFYVFLLVIWETARSRTGFIPAGLLTIYTASFAFWADIVATLGPSEIYATLGLALVIVGCDTIYRAGKTHGGWLLLLAGVTVAAGAKENFTVLAFLVIAVVIHAGIRRVITWTAWLCGGLSVLWCAWIAVEAVSRVQQSGVDVYGNSINFAVRLMSSLRAAGQAGIMPLYAIFGAFMLSWLFLQGRQTAPARASRAGVISCVLLTGLYVSQAFFYGAGWPTGTRYDLPGLLCWPILLFLLLWYVRQLAVSPDGSTRGRRLLSAGGILIGLLAVAGHANGLALNRSASAVNVRRTTHFTDAIEHLSGVAVQHPDDPILFESDDPWDFEALVSYPRIPRRVWHKQRNVSAVESR